MCRNDILNVCNYNYDFFLSKTNVIGVGLGYKETQGVDTGKDCIKVFVSKKLPIDQINSTDIVPANYNNLLTDVVEVGDVSALALSSKIRPTIGGYSIGPASRTVAGTLGCLATDNQGKIYILSNNHVLAGENLLPLNTSILQPAINDGGIAPRDTIATLANFVPIQYITSTNTPVNFVDCAIAAVTIPALVTNSIYQIGLVNGINLRPKLGLNIRKSGRTSMYTTGVLLAVGAIIKVSYSGGKEALFANQIIATSMGSPGDSGSLVVDNRNNAVGLLFAGNQSITLLNPINSVLTALSITII